MGLGQDVIAGYRLEFLFSDLIDYRLALQVMPITRSASAYSAEVSRNMVSAMINYLFPLWHWRGIHRVLSKHPSCRYSKSDEPLPLSFSEDSFFSFEPVR